MDIRRTVQLEAKNAYIPEGKGILNVSVRVGKTRIGLECMDHFSFVKKTLVCYPDEKIKKSWEDEIAKVGYKGEIIYTHYLSLHKHSEEKWDMVVFDEIHATSDRQREEMRKLISSHKY